MRWLLIVSFFFGCVEPNPGYAPEDASVHPRSKGEKLINANLPNSLWICHHPGTVFHEKECPPDDKLFPDGCLVEGDDSKFCWQLLRDDCVTLTTGVEWQEKFCPLLNGE